MSDLTIAIVVVPFLVVLTLALECTRIGCSWACRSYRTAKVQSRGGTGQGRTESQS